MLQGRTKIQCYKALVTKDTFGDKYMMFKLLLCVMFYLSYQCQLPSWLWHKCSKLNSMDLHVFFVLTRTVISIYIVNDVLERIWNDLSNEEHIYGLEVDQGEDDYVSENKDSYSDGSDFLGAENRWQRLIKGRQTMLKMVLFDFVCLELFKNMIV